MPRQSVVIYPSFGCLDRAERIWKIQIRGAVFEPFYDDYRGRLLVRLLRRAMKAESDILESEIFRQRVSTFLAQHERGKRIAIRVGDKTYCLRRRTRHNGHFRGILRLSLREVEHLRRTRHIRNNCLHFQVIARRGDPRLFAGKSQLIPPTGLSVISDIDDTMKRSDVPCRSELLVNTFLREFESVPGMSELYRHWAEQGAKFHYVSSSPWQLYQPLEELFRHAHFPPGSYHLRTLRLKDPRVISLLLPTRWGKQRIIRSILRSFPRRRFILVGDSGERDPELYGAAARRYPERIARIYIRDLATRSMGRQRIRRAFRGHPMGLWRIFDDAEQLAEASRV